MKKSLISLISTLLCLLILVSAVPVLATSYTENEEYRYTVENGEIKILDYLGDDENIIIPATIDEMPVTFLASRSFQQVGAVKTITVPDSVTVLEGNVFDFNPTLTAVFVDEENPCFKSVDGILFSEDMSTLLFYPDGKEGSTYSVPEGVSVIAPMAFGGCDNLSTVTFPEGLLFLGKNAFFMNDGIREINLPDSVIRVGDAAFDYCENLETVTFGKNLEYIGEAPFNNCPALSNLIADDENSNYNTVDNVLYSSMDELIRYPESKEYTEEYKVLDGTKTIGKSAFFSCRNIYIVTFPDTLETIDEYAFYHSGVCKVNLSKNLTTIGQGGFYDCQKLAEIILPESVNYIQDGAFGACIRLEKAILPTTLSRLGTGVFDSCIHLSEVQLPENLRYLPEYTFRACRSLTDLPYMNGVEDIGENAFIECHGLKDITIPASVTAINAFAFSNCDSLINVTIGPNVTFFGYQAIRNLHYAVTITGYRNTHAETYALENDLPFIPLEDDNTETDDEITPPEPDNGDTPTSPDPNVPMVLLGDSDLSGKINIKDATNIQKHSAGLTWLTYEGLCSSDADNNGAVDVRDATAIQKYLANMSVNDKIGTNSMIYEMPGDYVYIKDSAGWGNIHCYSWNDNSSNTLWPGEKAELVGTMDGADIYRCYIPSIFTNIIISSGINDNYSPDLILCLNHMYDTAKNNWIPMYE